MEKYIEAQREIKVQRALISLSDKTGLIDFAKELNLMKIEILSTGGTAKTLRDAQIPVIEVSDYTGFPEILDGRVKTLHPKIHGAILARRDNPSDMETIKKYDINTIDMIVVNLYPFEKTIQKKDAAFDEAIENIDIGGPTMLRAAAKNFKDVLVVVDSKDYAPIVNNLKENNGAVSFSLRYKLAAKVFSLTSSYDKAIFDFLTNGSL
ncbi:purine biosynthesis protein purH [Candidatus Magnetoovum chiemensis]|nr:purine biosynthesis protein purH [Candidatus Magnetoovum chiemensis]